MSTLSQFFPAGGNVPSNAIPIELLVVGGGGSSGGAEGGGGGGRVIHIHGLYVIPGVAYNVTVGAGGSGSLNGSESSFASQIFAPGGQGSGQSTAGGSGRGQRGQSYAYGGNLPGRYNITVANDHLSSKCYFGPDTRVLDLGNDGGYGMMTTANALYDLRGGGGGACSRGGDTVCTMTSTTGFHNGHNGFGGAGYYSDITGTYVYYGGGGNGYNIYTSYVPPAPAGSAYYSAGASNTGQGSGSGPATPSGGSGIVVVAYSSNRSAASTTGSPSTPTRSNYRVYQFTGSGSITFA